MPKLITVRHLGTLPGESHYEIHTPMGTWKLDMVKPSHDAGYGLAPRWFLTTPGEYTPDYGFDRKRDAVAYATLLVDEELGRNGGDAVRVAMEAHRMELHQDDSPWVKVAERQTTAAAEESPATKETATVTETAPRFVVNQLGNSYFAVRDLVTELDVATKTSRSGAQHIADALTDGTMVLDSLGRAVAAPVTDGDPLGAVDFGEPKCVHGFYERPADRGTAIRACERKPPAVSVGVFSDEGCVEFFDCAVEASDAAARLNAEEEATADDPAYRWAVLCAEHEEQPADNCEDCATEGCGAVDADDLDACGHCSDCTGKG